MKPVIGTVAWRRSSRCSSSTCVEVGRLNYDVVLRDSKIEQSPLLRYTTEEFRAFVEGVKAGEFDDLCH
jgi:hypothetical protein